MLKKIVDTALGKGAGSAEAFMLESESNGVLFQNSNLKSTNKVQIRGLAVRAIKDERLGFASSSDLQDPERIVDMALNVAGSGEHTDLEFPGPQDFESPPDLLDTAVKRTPIAELVGYGQDFVDKVREYDSSILAEVTLQTAKGRFSIINSKGMDASYEKSIFLAVFIGQIIIDTTVIYCYRHYAGTRKPEDLEGIMARAIDDFRLAKQSATIDSGKKTVIFTPRAMAELFEFLVAGVDGKNVEKGVSPIREKMGEQILDDRITVFENGALPGGLASAPFDDEGIPTSKRPIVEGGVLRSFVTDLTSAGRLNEMPSGNGFRYNWATGVQDYECTPVPRPTNWILEAGDTPYDDLMADIKEGVLVDQMMGLFTSNFLAGDFSGSLGLGYRIKDGEILGRVKDAMVAGNLYHLLNDKLIDMSRETERTIAQGGTSIFPYVSIKDVMITA